MLELEKPCWSYMYGWPCDERQCLLAMSDMEVGPVRDPREEREERSLALERTYVHEVYDQIAPQLQLQDNNRSRIWLRVSQFLSELEPASLVCDVGCGTGSYLDLNPEVFKVGSDRCRSLADIAHGRGPNGQEVLVCDNMQLPFRDESFDAVLSVAVVHHFATTERRVQALRELARVLRIGGRLMITVWALEQRHRRFESQDVLVPWHKPEPRSSSEEQTSIDKDMASTTTTSDDDLLNYHAYTSGLESEPYFVPFSRKHRIRERWLRRKGRTLDSSSQSSSDLSSPNETCYSFVRRALQKLSSNSGGAGGRTWEAGGDPRRRCRPPWFFKDVEHPFHRSCTFRLDKTDSLESTEDADDIPIELHDVDNAAELDRYWEEDGNGGRTPAAGGWCWTGATPYRPGRGFSSCSKPLNHKSKSLSDILSLFTANFRSSRKLSASTAEARTTSTCRRSTSSGSSVETKASANLRSSVTLEQLPEPVDTGQQLNAGEFEAIQTAVPGPVVHPRRRGSPTSYKSTTPACGDCRRPKSLMLPHDFRIPRTLSAEDHRNGNTILPDLDSCLTFYGFINKNNASDFSSPPYTKETSTPKLYESDHFNGKENISCTRPAAGPVAEKKRSQDFQAKSEKTTCRSTTDCCCKTDFKNTVYYEESPQCKDKLLLPEDGNEPVRVLNDNGWKDVVCLNLINRLIEHEHLFPFHSMPNIYISNFNETMKTDSFVGKQVPLCGHEMPTMHKEGGNVLKKQSFSVDGSCCMEYGSWKQSRENWCSRKPARLCFKRSMSTDDSEFNFPWKTTDNGRLPKEDSLQSDTSVDSDDSIASVIAVCKERNLSSGSGSNECRSDVRNEVGPLRTDSLENDVMILPCESLHTLLKDNSPEDLSCENLPLKNSPPLKTFKSSVCTSVSWEKYLDACQSTVLDTVEFVNSIYRDFASDDTSSCVDCPQLLPSVSQVFDSSHSQLIIDYVCSPGDEPQMAEMCWLDPGCGEAIADDLLLLSDSDGQSRISPNSQSPEMNTIVALSSSTANEHIQDGAASSSRVISSEYEDNLVMSAFGPEMANFEGCQLTTRCFDKRTQSADCIKEKSVRIKKKSMSAEEIKARREDEINGNVTNIFKNTGRHVDILDEVMDNVTETEDFQCEKQQSICEMNLGKCFSTKEYNFHKSCAITGIDEIISEEKVPIESRRECNMLQESSLEKTLLGGTQRMNSSNDAITLRKPSHTFLPATGALTPVGGKISASSDLELMSSSIETPFGMLEFLADADSDRCGPCQLSSVVVDKSIEAEACGVTKDTLDKDLEEPCADARDSLSVSTSDDSVLSGSENGGSPTFHRYYHVFREGELEQLIDKYVENLHIISSYYDHANWCIVAEKVRVWKI